MNTKSKKKNKQFRIFAKRIFLTYSQVHEELTAQHVLDELKTKHRFNKYIVAQERHQDQGKHFHVLLEKHDKFCIRNPTNLDIKFADEKFHGNSQEARNYKKVASYIAKENQYITNYPNFIDGELISVEEDMIRVAPLLGAEGASKYFLKNYPENALKGLSVRNVKSCVQAINNVNQGPKTAEQSKQLPFKFTDFTLPEELKKWIAQGCQPCLLLAGDGGTFKTTFCKMLAKEIGWNMLVCNHLEGFKELTPEHDAILLDDFMFNGLDEQQMLALIEADQVRKIRVLNGSISKPAGLHQMITLNVIGL